MLRLEADTYFLEIFDRRSDGPCASICLHELWRKQQSVWHVAGCDAGNAVLLFTTTLVFKVSICTLASGAMVFEVVDMARSPVRNTLSYTELAVLQDGRLAVFSLDLELDLGLALRRCDGHGLAFVP